MNDLYSSNVAVLNEGLRPFNVYKASAFRILKSWRRGDPQSGFKTGLRALDRFIRLVPSEVTILAARPGMGKTSLIMQIASNIVPDKESRQRVAIFSAEMSGWSLYMRLACAVAGVQMFRLRSGQATELEFDLMARAIESISTMPILVDDRSRPNVDYIAEELDRMSAAYEIIAMEFDFMELLASTGATEEQRVSNAMQGLKDIAKRFNMPVLAISHLNRDVDNRADKIPQISDLRYSGMIEQLADQIVLMVRPKYYLDKGIKVDLDAYKAMTPGGDAGYGSNLDDIAYLIIGKNRNGETGIARLGFDGPNMMFYDINRVPLEKTLIPLGESNMPEGDSEDDTLEPVL